MVFICRYGEFALLTHTFANLDLHVSDMGGFACTAAEEEEYVRRAVLATAAGRVGCDVQLLLHLLFS